MQRLNDGSVRFADSGQNKPFLIKALRIALVHNSYGKASGEEVVVGALAQLLTNRGHDVVRFSRSSEEIPGKWFGAEQAFVAGIYNPFARARFGRFLDENRPDVVHIHNLFPFISPSVLPECVRRKVPVVLTLHNFRFICPNALLLRDGHTCHDCVGGREWNCIRHNCEKSLPKSFGYAIRTAFARKSGLVFKHVDRFICLTNFQRDIHVGAGFPEDRMVVIPNPAPPKGDVVGKSAAGLCGKVEVTGDGVARAKNLGGDRCEGYVGYVGRVSPEKDVPTLLDAARMMPTVQFKIAGDYWRMPQLIEEAPPNVEFLGHLDKNRLEEFFGGMRVFAFATRCYENFPTVLLEAMSAGIPIVCTRIGGLAEIVVDEQCGLLYKVGDSVDLAAKIQRLWGDAGLRKRLVASGLEKVTMEYGVGRVYEQLMGVYEEVVRAKGAKV